MDVEEIFVLADDDAFVQFGMPANVTVACVAQTSFQNVLAIESSPSQILGERDG